MSFPHHTTTSSSSVSRSSRVHHSMSHTIAARALAGEGGKASDYQEDEIDSGSDDEEGSGQSHPLLEEDFAAKQVSLFLVSCLIHYICDGMEIIHVPYLVCPHV